MIPGAAPYPRPPVERPKVPAIGYNIDPQDTFFVVTIEGDTNLQNAYNICHGLLNNSGPRLSHMEHVKLHFLDIPMQYERGMSFDVFKNQFLAAVNYDGQRINCPFREAATVMQAKACMEATGQDVEFPLPRGFGVYHLSEDPTVVIGRYTRIPQGSAC